MMRKLGNWLIALGVVCILGGSAWAVGNELDEYRAQTEAQDAVEQLEKAARAQLEKAQGEETDQREEPTAPAGVEEAALMDPADESMPTLTVNGRTYIGTLIVPDIGLELPVQSRCSEKLLKHSPCWYAGSLKQGNLIIAGHNYKHHFTPLSQLRRGAKAIFRDVEEQETVFTMIRSDVVKGTDIAGMLAGDDGWDLTLFTCTYGGKERLAVRFVRE